MQIPPAPPPTSAQPQIHTWTQTYSKRAPIWVQGPALNVRRQERGIQNPKATQMAWKALESTHMQLTHEVWSESLAKAKEQAIKIRDDAKKQIEVEKDKANSDIKQEVVNLTLSVAEKLINKNLNDADNKSLIEESLKKVKSYEAWF